MRNKPYRRKPKYYHKCENCETKNGEYYIKQNGAHYELHCSVCNYYIKSVEVSDILYLTGNININKVYDNHNREIDAYTAMGLEKPKPFDTYIDVDTLSEEEYLKLNLPF